MALVSRILSWHGVVPIYKDKGLTTVQAMAKIKRFIIEQCTDDPEKRKLINTLKVGHGGTLDPIACGIVAIGLNKGCKSLTEILKGTKTYVAVGKFGELHDTLDATGKDKLEETLKFFRGDILQVPPIFSAIKINGERSYDLARRSTNEQIVHEPRPITIYELELKGYDFPYFTIEATCSGGTYVRSLIGDIAAEIGTIATMTDLERTKCGRFSLEDCFRLTPESTLRDLEKHLHYI